ncbi:hypothetical protein [Azospirillum canadense]|uniref:hypothetical protein n=1 Tax=Azospirillum canadense TaxID=403962 RepID=UPI0022277F7C|nr:hypothetical protein [Azospirillum canadense]MCW2237474.1 hypothetical protein [Azospirillum canadense]
MTPAVRLAARLLWATRPDLAPAAIARQLGVTAQEVIAWCAGFERPGTHAGILPLRRAYFHELGALATWQTWCAAHAAAVQLLDPHEDDQPAGPPPGWRPHRIRHCDARQQHQAGPRHQAPGACRRGAQRRRAA